MKFAKELERESVPEWRIKYLNYKAGKKHVKAVTRSIQRATLTSRIHHRRTSTCPGVTQRFRPKSDERGYDPEQPDDRDRDRDRDHDHDHDHGHDNDNDNHAYNCDGRNEEFGIREEEVDEEPAMGRWTSRTQPINIIAKTESEGLTSNSEGLQYGSFVATPPSSSWPAKHFESGRDRDRDNAQPPLAAVDSHGSSERGPAAGATRKSLSGYFAGKRSLSSADVPRPTKPLSGALPPSSRESAVVDEGHQTTLQRFISHAREPSMPFSRAALGRQSFDLVRKHEQEFFAFMDAELNKVETFYKQKEEQAGKRLDVLREQLHEMRNRRILEMAGGDEQHHHDGLHSPIEEDAGGGDKLNGWVQPLRTKIFPLGPNSKAFKSMGPAPTSASGNTTLAATPTTLLSPRLASGGRPSLSWPSPLPSPSSASPFPGPFPGPLLVPIESSPRARQDPSKDFSKRPSTRHQISYRAAKRKLKRAILEFYRSLELLKSYALLNRTAFRKLNKKYDKAAHASPPLRFVTEKVNSSYFVNSLVLEEHLKTVEDLYSRYFERGNQKLAAGKLRRLTKRPRDESGSAFKNGLLLGTGLVFGIQGLVLGVGLLNDAGGGPDLRAHTNYLLQIYAGYFLMLFLFFLFCVDCFIWSRNKVNYPFIFEFDQRTQLDWRELSEFPSFCLLLLGLAMRANFSRYGGEGAYLYWPAVLIVVTVVLIFLPAPVLAYRSRKWFAFSHGRLFCAGLFPVEFRDFFLGDMYCSLTYAMANIELFFCLYARDWEEPMLCGSSHSRLLGFLTCLPPIWRFFQCIRRYRDTGNAFPHLANCGKYSMSITASMCLSLYRIHRTEATLALFITFNVINGIYCALWDLFMDFSLLQPESRHYYLRDITAFKSRWIYYAIMTVDPLFRFSWVFYIFFTFHPRYASLVSFTVALIEVTRRGIWALLRVENEHCSNVSQYKASRDVPLPYRLEPMLDVHTPTTAIGADDITLAPSQPSPTQDQVAQPLRLSHDSLKSNRQDAQLRTSGSGGASLRHAYTSSVAASSAAAAPEAPVPRARRRTMTLHSRIGSRNFSQVLADAHKQDSERKRRPDEVSEEHAVPEEQSDDEDDEDEDDLDANSFMDVRTPRRSLSRAETAA